MRNEKNCILIADDEKEIRDILYLLLSSEGYEVIVVTNGSEAVRSAREDIDLYILDVNMPEMSGFVAASEIRKTCDSPIIFLTAYSSESDKVMGFSVGADDYIVKPFSHMELLMRTKAILRRRVASAPSAPVPSSSQLAIQDLILDLDQQTILRGGEPIVLTYTEFKILELLASNRKKIFSLDHIYNTVWKEEAVSDSAIMLHIKNLRKKLGDDSRNPKYIKTAWGRGYYVD